MRYADLEAFCESFKPEELMEPHWLLEYSWESLESTASGNIAAQLPSLIHSHRAVNENVLDGITSTLLFPSKVSFSSVLLAGITAMFAGSCSKLYEILQHLLKKTRKIQSYSRFKVDSLFVVVVVVV